MNLPQKKILTVKLLLELVENNGKRLLLPPVP